MARPKSQELHSDEPKRPLCNRDLAELLAQAAETAEGHLRKALTRASTLALTWPKEVQELLLTGTPLSSLPGIGPHLQRLLLQWLEARPIVRPPPDMRRNFFTLADAHRILAAHPSWASSYQGDLQMHSQWSDGSGSIQDMAETAFGLGHRYIAIDTDAHSPGQLLFAQLGLAAAAQADINRERVVNFMRPPELLQWVSHIRASARTPFEHALA